LSISRFILFLKKNAMGKGDKKTRRGKITKGTYGVSRPKKVSIKSVEKPKKKSS